MRLLVFTENYVRGGGNRYLVDLVNGMGPSFDSVVLASNPGGLFAEDLARLGVVAETRSVPVLTSAPFHHAGGFVARVVGRVVTAADPVAFELNTRRIGRLIVDVRPDVLLVCNGGFPAARSVLAAAVAGGRAELPVAMAVVGMPIPRRSAPRWYERRVDERVWASVDFVVTSGSAILGRLETLRGLPSGRGAVLPNALPDRGPAHAAHEGALTVGCVARVARSKGMLELADAFVRVAPAFLEARLRVVGEGDAREEMRARLAQAGLTDRVEFPGYVSGDDAVAEEVARLDVYALPTHGEMNPAGEEGGGPPYSILEAMRAGTAIVTTSVGSIADGVTDGCEGLLVPPQDAAALAEAIGRLLSDEDLRRRLGEGARARFLRDFTLEQATARAARLARELIATARSPRHADEERRTLR